MTSETIEGLGLAVHDAARLVRKRFDERAAAHGLSAAQWRLLVRLVKDEGAPQARLAELLEIEPISVSRLLDRMEEGGWIERRLDAADRRVRTVFPTEKGRQAFAAVKSMAGDIYEAALAGVPETDRRVLMRALAVLVANLSDDAAFAPSSRPLEGAAL